MTCILDIPCASPQGKLKNIRKYHTTLRLAGPKFDAQPGAHWIWTVAPFARKGLNCRHFSLANPGPLFRKPLMIFADVGNGRNAHCIEKGQFRCNDLQHPQTIVGFSCFFQTLGLPWNVLNLSLLSPDFRGLVLLNYTENLEKKQKIQWRASSGDGAPKLQISVPCRGRTCPEKLDLFERPLLKRPFFHHRWKLPRSWKTWDPGRWLRFLGGHELSSFLTWTPSRGEPLPHGKDRPLNPRSDFCACYAV